MTQAATLDNGTATVSVSALAPFIRMLEEAGERAVLGALERSEESVARWGLSLSDLGSDTTARMPHGLVVDLLSDFTEALGDPSAPVRAGAKLQLGDYGLLEYLTTSCNTLGETIACLGRYYPLLIHAEKELVISGDRAEARFRIAPGLDAPDAIHEFGLASNFAMSILHLQLEGVQMPLEVCFSHSAPEYASVFSEVFFTKVSFECEHNAIVFPVSMVNHPMRTADPALHAVLKRQADQELAALSDHNAFPAKVRAAIEAELGAGAPLEAVAARMHISPSSLRARLRQHGSTYSDVLDRLRRDRAKRALRQSQLSAAEVAHSLGFAHAPAFHRAFRRWFGMTPSEYREAPSTSAVTKFWRRAT
jgi:AraC-like DNA-binding protein